MLVKILFVELLLLIKLLSVAKVLNDETRS